MYDLQGKALSTLWAGIVAQLAEWSFPTRAVHSFDFIQNMYFRLTVEKTKIKKKRTEIDNLKKYQTLQLIVGPLEIQAS